MMKCTEDIPHRCVILDGVDGSVVCVIYGKNRASTLFRLSQNWKFENATRSLLQMHNLTVCRGSFETCMFGPCDFFGTLEYIACKYYIIQIKNEIPVFFEVKNHFLNKKKFNQNIIKKLPPYILLDDIEWKSHFFLQTKKTKQSSSSLFPNPGLLLVNVDFLHFDLNYDSLQVDLTSYNARLVSNESPFQLLQNGSHHCKEAYDDLRVISYIFGPTYTSNQIQYGDGLFLECHNFIQSITPLNQESKGFVMLAKFENRNQISLIGVCIPFGYTLIIDSFCIHGDTTLNGFFCMAMTSNHLSMATSDTVFIRNKENNNVSIINQTSSLYPKYNIVPNTHIYQRLDKKWPKIFNPFSINSWKY